MPRPESRTEGCVVFTNCLLDLGRPIAALMEVSGFRPSARRAWIDNILSYSRLFEGGEWTRLRIHGRGSFEREQIQVIPGCSSPGSAVRVAGEVPELQRELGNLVFRVCGHD